MGEETKSNLAQLEANRAEREKEREKVLNGRREVLFALEERLEAELGPRGEAFEIIDGGPCGPIAVKPGEAVLYKRYRQKVKTEKDTQEDLIAFVRPCVCFPSLEKFDEITGKYGVLLDKCGGVLAKLYGGWEDQAQGKS